MIERKLKFSTIHNLIQAHYSGKVDLAQFIDYAKEIIEIFNPNLDNTQIESRIQSILVRLENRHSVREKI